MTRTIMLILALSAAPAAAFAQAGDAAAPDKRLEERFSRLDTDKDGRITAAELRAQRDARFRAMDGDKDGSITAAEFDKAAQDRAGERSRKLFERLDANKDGKLAREEIEPPNGWMARLDANGDGALTVEEMRSGRRGPDAPSGRPAN